ncbi:MAG: hypothetical protein AYK19_18230 [Theionarchaea archaeon DG-70-1]|nr:MAG: hypothetical protein AYK19_18230 [Theionarchaea archaeon DG-70-1]
MEQSQYVRPMGFGEILDSAVRLFRKNFFALVIAQLPLTLFYLVNNLISIYFVGPGGLSFFETLSTLSQPTVSPEPVDLTFFFVAFLLAIIQVALVYPLALAAVTKVASDSVLQNRSSVKDAYKFCLRNWFKLGSTNVIITIALVIIMAIVLFIPVAVFVAVFAYAYATGPSLGAVAGILLILLVFMLIALLVAGFFWARWVAAFPIMVNERTFLMEAMSRSWNMVKGKTIRTLFVMVAVFLIPTILQYSSAFLEFSLGRSLVVLTVVFGIVSQGLLIPLVDCTRVVIYFELRARKEGFDLEKRAEQLK